MVEWLKSKSQIEKLEERYAQLMKRSFKIALKDKTKSDSLSEEADALLQRIRILKFKSER